MGEKYQIITNPNYLTFGRFILTIPLPFTFMLDKTWALTFSFALMILIGSTDFLDGWMARRYGKASDIGELIDSMADGFARLTIFILFASAGLVPGWMVIICLWRDVISWTLKILGLVQKRQILRKRISGKIMGVTHSFAIVVIMVNSYILGFVGTHDVDIINYYAMLGAAITSTISLLDLMITHKKYVLYFLSN